MAWIIHHLDLIEHYSFQYAQHLLRRHSSLKAMSRKRMQVLVIDYIRRSNKNRRARLTYSNAYHFGSTDSTPIKKYSR